MADIVKKTIKSSGGDYAGLNAAIDGEAHDLVALDRILHFECYGFEDTTAVAAASWTNYVMDKTHYMKIYQAENYRSSGIMANRGNEVYYHNAPVNGNPSIPVVSGMYIHMSGIHLRNGGGGVGTTVFNNTTSNTLTNGGVVCLEGVSSITTGHVFNFNTLVGGIEVQCNSCYLNGHTLDTIYNPSNGKMYFSNCTLVNRASNAKVVNAAGAEVYNCVGCELDAGTAFNSVAGGTTSAATDATAIPASLDAAVDWGNTNDFVGGADSTNIALTAAGDAAIGGAGTTPDANQIGKHDFGNLFIDIHGNLFNTGVATAGWAIGAHEYGGLAPVPGVPGSDVPYDGSFAAIYVLG